MTRARKLCTKPELDLVASARPGAVKELSPARLRGKIARARKLRDKFRDLEKGQARRARGKQGPRRASPEGGHERTTEKADLFEDVLARFEERAAKLDRAAERGEKASSRKAAKKSARKPAGARKAAKTKKPKPAALARKKATAGKLSARSAKKAASKASTRARQKTESSLLARKAQKAAQRPGARIRGHVTAAGRRNQARRDAR